jgi:hypothetical protein
LDCGINTPQPHQSIKSLTLVTSTSINHSLQVIITLTVESPINQSTLHSMPQGRDRNESKMTETQTHTSTRRHVPLFPLHLTLRCPPPLSHSFSPSLGSRWARSSVREREARRDMRQSENSGFQFTTASVLKPAMPRQVRAAACGALCMPRLLFLTPPSSAHMMQWGKRLGMTDKTHNAETHTHATPTRRTAGLVHFTMAETPCWFSQDKERGHKSWTIAHSLLLLLFFHFYSRFSRRHLMPPHSRPMLLSLIPPQPTGTSHRDRRGQWTSQRE